MGGHSEPPRRPPGITVMPPPRRRSLAAVAAATLLLACAPKAPPLVGLPVPPRLPDTRLPPLHRQITFTWSYTDADFRARGDGAARVSPPDSVRLDFFVANGLGGGRAVLIGDDLRTPKDGGAIRRYLPPVPLLWAAFGRLALPPVVDTAARVDGDTLRIEIGRDPAWRAAFVGSALRRLEEIDGGRVPRSLTRGEDGHVVFRQASARRMLEITVLRVDTLSGFDAAIWQ